MRYSKYIESLYPYFGAAIITVAASRLPIETPLILRDAGFNVPTIYGIAQNIELFASGILFSVFVFTMAPAAGFIAKLQKLRLFGTFRRYVLEALLLGIFGSALCIPLATVLVERMPTSYFPLLSMFAVATFSAFSLSSIRVVRIFFFWSSQA